MTQFGTFQKFELDETQFFENEDFFQPFVFSKVFTDGFNNAFHQVTGPVFCQTCGQQMKFQDDVFTCSACPAATRQA